MGQPERRADRRNRPPIPQRNRPGAIVNQRKVRNARANTGMSARLYRSENVTVPISPASAVSICSMLNLLTSSTAMTVVMQVHSNMLFLVRSSKNAGTANTDAVSNTKFSRLDKSARTNETASRLQTAHYLGLSDPSF